MPSVDGKLTVPARINPSDVVKVTVMACAAAMAVGLGEGTCDGRGVAVGLGCFVGVLLGADDAVGVAVPVGVILGAGDGVDENAGVGLGVGTDSVVMAGNAVSVRASVGVCELQPSGVTRRSARTKNDTLCQHITKS
jgi:hypothetical protein